MAWVYTYYMDSVHNGEPERSRVNHLVYYKRGDAYICSAKAPVLEGSGSRRLYPLKGTSVGRVYVVFGARVDLGFCLLFVKNGFVVAFAECNSAPLKQIRRLLL